MKIFASTAQQLPLHQINQLPNTQHQQLPYDWWQKLQALLRPRPPRPDNDGTDQDSGAAQSSGQCGVTSLSTPPIGHFIVGGQEAQPGQFPWQVCPPPLFCSQLCLFYEAAVPGYDTISGTLTQCMLRFASTCTLKEITSQND